MNSYPLQRLLQFLPTPLPIEINMCLSNPIPYPQYIYLSILTFLVDVTEQINHFLVSDNY